MRHLTAVQIDGGWHYASLGSRGGGPIGYCAEHAPHPTEREARECYARYQRDRITLDGELASWSDCRVCGAPTKRFAQTGAYGFESLCAEHLTHHHAVEVMHLDAPAGDSWQS